MAQICFNFCNITNILKRVFSCSVVFWVNKSVNICHYGVDIMATFLIHHACCRLLPICSRA